ncbi:VOC family protein [Ruegeria sp. R14_0]|uniref:VOC family protein n=1 Tax=Ruegeria sp. R14_0 TaxID=2821100 RepID=UPI001ADA2334|nr:VOC family protein [Ruegeria sp. R14_0]MBO9446651.1 VOC family protein [Ruegeria sp. R14_0]
MIAYISVGADDMKLAERFYSAFLPDLGYHLEYYHGDLSFALPAKSGHAANQPEFYVKSPFNGLSASAGNGTMVAFQARNQQQVRDLHSAAIAAGGSDEGAPGFREYYGPNFFVGYLRDPQGNKIALFSSDPSEAERNG